MGRERRKASAAPVTMRNNDGGIERKAGRGIGLGSSSSKFFHREIIKNYPHTWSSERLPCKLIVPPSCSYDWIL